MNLSSFISFFKKASKALSVPDTILVKKLKNLATNSNLLILKDTKIYHHTEVYNVGLMVLDTLRGLYLFEAKEWTFDELKNANIQKAEKQEHSSDTLAFDNTQNIIRKKFNEITHNDGVPIYNYLLMENLNADEYEHLNDSFKTLLPKEKIIFSDSLQADIFKKLHNASPALDSLPSSDAILGTLLIQYAILDENSTIHLASSEQRQFIDKELKSFEMLNGLHGSGKSSLLLLKSIVNILNNKAKKIIIIEPTTLASDILKKKLLEIIEHAIIDFNLTAIEIITPLELVNRHYAHLGKETCNTLEIDEKLMRKSFHQADTIMCDDSYLYSNEFIAYLKHIQKKEKLLVVTCSNDATTLLHTNYRAKGRVIQFLNVNPHAKALRIISTLLNNKAKNIVVVSNSISRDKLKEDLDSFILDDPYTLESSTALINQNFTNLMMCNYTDLHAIQVNHIILMDLCFVSKNLLEYALNLSKISVDVLYEEGCQEIKALRNKYEQESSKE